MPDNRTLLQTTAAAVGSAFLHGKPMLFNTMWLRAFVAVIVTTAPLVPAHGESTDATAYVTPHSVAAITLRVAETIRMPFAENYPIEVVAAASEDFLGLPIDAIDRVTAVLEPPMGITPQYVVVLNATVPILLENFRSELTKHTEAGELLGHPLLESREDLLPSYCLANDRTLLIGPKLYLKRLLRGVDSSGGDLLEAMRSDGAATNHLHAAITMQPLKPLMEMGLEQAKANAEPDAAPFLDGVLLLDRAVAAIDLSGSRPSAITVYANDAEAADQIEALMADGLFMVRREILSDPKVEELRNHPEAVARAWLGYVERMFDVQATELSTFREGDDAFVIGRFDASNPGSQLGAIYVGGILIALLLPAVQAAREAARRNQSLNNVKQLMLALHNYYDTNRSFPPHAIYSETGEPLLSWRVAVLPYLGETDLYEQFHRDEPWNSEHNLPLVAKMPDLFLDPSSPKLSVTDGKTSYLGVVGEGAALSGDASGRTFGDFTDGTTKTIVMVQVDDEHAVEWSRPADFDYAKHQLNPIEGIGSVHPGVFLAGYADAHSQAIKIEIDPGVLSALMTIGGGEMVDSP